MLKNITWLQYFIALLLILIPYYTYLLLRYYKRKKNTPKGNENQFYEDDFQQQEYAEEPDFDSIPDDLFTQAQELIAKLKAFIKRASTEGIAKEELLVNLKSYLDDYPSLNTEAFRPAINEMIVAECDRNSSVTLSEREADGLWE